MTQSKASILRYIKQSGYRFTSLLTKPESQPKAVKNGKVGTLTSILHLAPAKLSGYEVCPMRSAGCTAACLHTSGNPVYMEGKNRARIERTRLYFEQRDTFFNLLCYEIQALVRRAEKQGSFASIRLNGTSDIPFERIKADIFGGKTIFDKFPHVQFYDYTKRHNRKNLPENYHLTYSLAEDNDDRAAEAFENGLNVAVVFDTKRNKALPAYYTLANGQSVPVIDGDVHDYRPDDGQGVIVGLRAKGDAIGDTSGFVRAA